MSYMKIRRPWQATHGPEARKNQYQDVLGTKHPLPAGMTRDEYEQLRRTWDKKLAESGFKDVEKTDPRTGLVAPEFKTSGLSSQKSIAEQANSFRADKVEYFRLCRCFLEHADFAELFGKKSWLYRTIFEMHCEGASYRKIAKHFRSTAVPPQHRRPKASMFWSHWHTEHILAQMWPWHRSHPEGLLLAGESDD